MSKHRVRTHSGHSLYLHSIDTMIPGETQEMELNERQLEIVTGDCRILVDEKIDQVLEALERGNGKPRGNAFVPGASKVAEHPKATPDKSAKGKRRRSRRSEVE